MTYESNEATNNNIQTHTHTPSLSERKSAISIIKRFVWCCIAVAPVENENKLLE